MNKIILRGHDARKRMVKGAEYLSSIVRTTYGPYGHNVVIGKGSVRPVITKDGATVDNAVDSDDPFMKIGIQTIKDVVSKVDSTSGDGTTTATIYASELMKGAEKLASLGFNGRVVRKGLQAASDEAVKYLESKKSKVDDIRAIADVSSNGSKEITDLLVEAINSVGEDGAIQLDESTSKDGRSYVKVLSGYQWDFGFPSSKFISNFTDKSSIVKEPWILVSAQPIDSSEDWDALETLRGQAQLSKKNLVIIAPFFNSAYYEEASKSGILFLISPGRNFSQEKQMDYLQDIAALVNTKVIPDWSSLSKVIEGVDDLGTCACITAHSNDTKITLPEELSEKAVKRLEDHVKELQKLIDENDELSVAQCDALKERIASISGGIATIFVGALTPIEKEEKFALVLDALNSVNNAIKYGVLPGGGTALLKTSNYLLENCPKDFTEEEKAGWELVAHTLREPAKILIETAKPEDYQYIVQQVAHEKDFNKGYEMMSDKICDLLKEGIIDAAKIEMDVIRYSCSAISSFLLTDGIIVDAVKNANLDVVDSYMADQMGGN